MAVKHFQLFYLAHVQGQSFLLKIDCNSDNEDMIACTGMRRHDSTGDSCIVSYSSEISRGVWELKEG